MSCLTNASHYEFATFAFQQGRLALGAWYAGRGDAKKSNTFIWAEANNWYEDRPTGWFGRIFKWGHAEQRQSFLLKSIASRFNFVIATNTHGTDLQVFNSREFTDQPFDWVSEDGSERERQYDLWSYNNAYRKYALGQFNQGLGPSSSEPQMRDFRREQYGKGTL